MSNRLVKQSSVSRKRVNRTSVLQSAALAALAFVPVQSASAAIQTWSGGSGTWDTTSTKWPSALWAGDAAQFGPTAGIVTVDAGGVSANQIIFAHTATGYTISGGTITMTGPAVIGWTGSTPSTSSTISSVLAGSNGLTFQSGAAGTGLELLTLTGVNTYTGATTLFGGTVTLAGSNASNAAVINGGALKLDFGAATAPANNIILSGASLTLGYGGTYTVTSKAGTANTQTAGGLTISTGSSTLNIINGSGTATAAVDLGAITRQVGGTANFVQPTVNTTISAANGFISSTGVLGPGLTVNGTDWAFNNGTNIVAFSAYTTQRDANLWTTDQHLTNNGGYFGTVGANLTVGSLRFNNAAASAITLGGTTLVTSNGILLTSAVGANASTITGGTLKGTSGKDLVIIQNNTGALVISSTIADNGGATALTKSGTGILTLFGSNTYTGGTYINGGTVNFNNDNAVGTGPLTLLTGTTIDNTSGGTITLAGTSPVSWGTTGLASALTYTGTGGSVLNMAAGGLVIQAPVTVGNMASGGNSFTLTVNNGVLNIMGSLTGATGFYNTMLIKGGAGTLALSGANTFPAAQTATSGRILLRGGTLALNNALALNGGGLTVNTLTALDNTTSGAITLTSNPTLSFQSGMNFTGTQSLNYGTGGVTFQASPTISVSANTLTLGGVIGAAAFGLTKAGPGTLALGGTNLYTGGTTVAAGKLSIATTGSINTTSGIALGAGEFNYNNTTTALNKVITFTGTGGIVSGSGRITTAVAVTAGNSIRPGNGVGTLSTGALSMAAGSAYRAEIDVAAQTADQIKVTGGVTLDGTLELVILNGVDGPLTPNQKYILIDNVTAGAITGNFSVISPGSTENFVYEWSTTDGDGNDFSVTIKAVPEPASISLLGLAAGAILARRRAKPRRAGEMVR